MCIWSKFSLRALLSKTQVYYAGGREKMSIPRQWKGKSTNSRQERPKPGRL